MKPKILFFSINSISAIPVFRLILTGLESTFFSRIIIIECFLDDMSSRFELPYEHIDILHFRNANAFNNQSLLEKLKKYIRIIRYLFKYLQDDTFLYTCDLEVLTLSVLIKRLKGSQCRIIYHQFEAIERERSTTLKRISLDYLKKVGGIDLAIFPERNRLALFCGLINMRISNAIVFPNTCHAKPALARQNDLQSRIRVGHVGNLSSEAFYLEEFLKSLKIMHRHDFQFIFVGVKDKGIEAKIREVVPDAEVMGWLNHTALKDIYETLDIGLILYKPLDFNTDYCAPNKLYEYWSYGVPVIAPELRGLLPVFDSTKKGQLVDFNDPKKVAYIFENWIDGDGRQTKRDDLLQLFRQTLSIDVFLQEWRLKLNGLV